MYLFRYPDEVIDYWADIYEDQRVRFTGVSFNLFLFMMTWDFAQPDCLWQGEKKVPEFLPLLQQQEAVAEFMYTEDLHALQEELDGDDQIVFRGGAHVEPLHHKKHQSNRKSCFRPKAKPINTMEVT